MVARARRRAVSTVLLLLGAFGDASEARAAEPSTQARQAYDHGAEAFAGRDYVAAATSFLAADALSPNDATIEMALRAAEAAKDPLLVLSIVDRTDGRKLSDDVQQHRRAAKEKALGETGEIVVTCDAACEYRVDNGDWRSTPSRAVRGTHAVAVRSGELVKSGDVVLKGGDRRQVTISFHAQPKAGADVKAEAADRPSPPSPLWFYVTAGAAVVAGGVTAVSAVQTQSLHSQWETSNFDPNLRSQAVSAQTRTDVALLVTVILAAGATVLAFVTTPWEASSENTAGRPNRWTF